MSSYVSKVTQAGQITIPKSIRESLGLGDEDFVEFTQVGDAILMQKLKASKGKVDAIRRKIRRSGITRERVEAIVEETRGRLYRTRHH